MDICELLIQYEVKLFIAIGIVWSIVRMVACSHPDIRKGLKASYSKNKRLLDYIVPLPYLFWAISLLVRSGFDENELTQIIMSSTMIAVIVAIVVVVGSMFAVIWQAFRGEL